MAVTRTTPQATMGSHGSLLIPFSERAQERHEEERGPDHLAEEDGLVHRGGLHVEQAGVEREEEGGDDGPGGTQPVAREAPEAGDAEDVAGHRWDSAGNAVLPPRHARREGHDEQVREREPDGANLTDAGVERVEDTAGDVQVRDRVAVEQHHAARETVAEGQQRKQRGDHADEDGFVAERASRIDRRGGTGVGIPATPQGFIRGARAGGRAQSVPRFRWARAVAGARCRIAPRQTIP